jgi:hypothetical protein
MKQEKFFPLALALFALIGIPHLAAQIPIPGHSLDILSLDELEAVPTISTQARYSAGIFTGDVDDFIDVNAYNPDIGTFFFLGGFPAASTGTITVDTTDQITGTASPYNISFGFAHSFTNFYLGLYFGGSFVGADGQSDAGRNSLGAGDKKTTFSHGDWDLNLAVLLGQEQLGGLRLDLSVDGESASSKYGGEGRGNGGTGTTYGDTYANATTNVVLSWGNGMADNLDVNAKFGIQFPEYVLTNLGTPNTEVKAWTGGLWGLRGGVSYALNEISTLDAALTIGGRMGNRSKRWDGKTQTSSGSFGIIIDAALPTTFSPVAGLELGLSPNLGLGLLGNGNNTKLYDGTKTDGPDTTDFELVLGVDAGVKVQLPGKLNKFSIVSGAGLNLFDWYSKTEAGGTNPKLDRVSGWKIDEVSWNGDTLAAGGNLGFGLVFEPNQNLSAGIGLNAILNNLVTINLATMQIKPGAFFTNAQPGITGSASGPFGGLFLNGATPITLDLTVSYKF